jgi:lysylphosphatidylglycerol synthetase-like protein (DUF2156 family)
MRKLLRTALALVGVVVIVTFAVGNRHLVELSFWPLPFSRSIPVYGLLLVGIGLGVLLGAVAAWLSGHSRRLAYRSMRQRVTGLEYQERQHRAAEEAAAAERAIARIPSAAH